MCCSGILYVYIIIPDSDLLQSSTYLNSQRSILRMLLVKVQSVTQTNSHYVLISWTSEPVDNIAAPGVSNPRLFGYESYALTNCAITVRYIYIYIYIYMWAHARACVCVCVCACVL